MPDLAVERTLESVHCSKLTLFHRVIINCTDICISWNWERILYNNIALILFHGVSPNPLASKVMVPKLTSRQRMFAYKADQIHRGRIILLSEWIRVLRRSWLFLREFHFSGDIACHTFAGGNCPGTVTMWGVSLDRWCAVINTLTCHKYVRADVTK